MARQTDSSYSTIAGIYVVEATNTVTSADAFYEWMRDTPNYVPRRIARDIWSQYQEQTLWSDYRDRMEPDAPLLRRFFSDVQAEHSQTYNVKIRYAGVDPESGEALEDYLILGFDHAPSLSEIENWALGGTDSKGPFPIQLQPTWSIEYLYHRKDRPW